MLLAKVLDVDSEVNATLDDWLNLGPQEGWWKFLRKLFWHHFVPSLDESLFKDVECDFCTQLHLTYENATLFYFLWRLLIPFRDFFLIRHSWNIFLIFCVRFLGELVWIVHYSAHDNINPLVIVIVVLFAHQDCKFVIFQLFLQILGPLEVLIDHKDSSFFVVPAKVRVHAQYLSTLAPREEGLVEWGVKHIYKLLYCHEEGEVMDVKLWVSLWQLKLLLNWLSCKQFTLFHIQEVHNLLFVRCVDFFELFLCLFFRFVTCLYLFGLSIFIFWLVVTCFIFVWSFLLILSFEFFQLEMTG